MGNMEPENTPAVEGTGEEWSGPSQEEWSQMTEFLGSLQQAMEAPPEAEPQQEGQQEVQIDPFADDFQSRLDAYLDSKLAPVNELSQNAAYAEADERAADIITDLQAQHGEFMLPDSADLAKVLANEYVQEAQERYGFGPRAAEAALEQAYKDVKAREEAIGKAYHERQMNQLSTLGKASREPAVDATAAQQVNSVKGNEMDLVRSYFTPNTGAN
jgi:hypothetical protein